MKAKHAKTRSERKKGETLRKVARDLAPQGDVKAGSMGCPACGLLGKTK